MRKAVVLLLAGSLLLVACAGPGLRQDCLERKKKADRAADLAATELRAGLTGPEVRALLGAPDEITTAGGLGSLELWKYYLLEDCRAQLGMTALETRLIFLDGKLAKWTTTAR